MKLMQVITNVDGRISGSDYFLWDCWGNNVQILDLANKNGAGYAHCYYDRKTFEVYLVHVEIPNQDCCWVWFAPAHRAAYFKDSQNRNINPLVAWDNVLYQEILDEEKILSILNDIGQENLSHYFDQA